ncbi:UDP-N-acetylmuramoyl-L-alanyl-D-glutamate--2,6-diaminopimelate ligase [Atopobacter phocae]|uniref:UDP-N-acetylmuramoyl-L-alanyl-D-glutamate--2, 6-diaminopimelate ligase n=1 Tax=Atopobacter phocae TaxID=136492 RepID=UPI000470A035|nr:UDP-N-acetylmuramoyl-L-alanyl-D-glutamate--2,6-diaminopimelate ligase [Atopobacter phocae]
MNVTELFPNMTIPSSTDYPIQHITTNTKDVKENTLFIAIKGARINTHDEHYLKEAYEKGARVFVLEEVRDLPADALPIIVPNTREMVGLIASHFYGNPSHSLKVIGVTGTKGKTSVTYILKGLLEGLNKKVGVIGTNGAVINGEQIDLDNTTPDPITLQRLFRQAVDAQVEFIAMEVSSQAMKQWRVNGTHFNAALFTNLSQDHIGPTEHATFEEYRDAKKALLYLADHVIINRDDEHFDYLTHDLDQPVISIGTHDANYVITPKENQSFMLNKATIQTNLYGGFNQVNLSLAIAALYELGFSVDEQRQHTQQLAIPGRMEVIHKNERTFLIDYAHNELSLTSLFNELKSWNKNRTILVIGSVGNRTYERRKEIPSIANQFVDEIVLTSDDPYYEPPMDIIEEMASYSTIPTKKIENRAEAIRAAYIDSEPGDLIIVAGKGAETFQKVKGEHVPHNDKETVLSL